MTTRINTEKGDALSAYERFKIKVIGKVHQHTTARCWFLHHWGRWTTYNRNLYRWGMDEKYHRCDEARQCRTCSRCGLTQDREVRDG